MTGGRYERERGDGTELKLSCYEMRSVDCMILNEYCYCMLEGAVLLFFFIYERSFPYVLPM